MAKRKHKKSMQINERLSCAQHSIESNFLLRAASSKSQTENQPPTSIQYTKYIVDIVVGVAVARCDRINIHFAFAFRLSSSCNRFVWYLFWIFLFVFISFCSESFSFSFLSACTSCRKFAESLERTVNVSRRSRSERHETAPSAPNHHLKMQSKRMKWFFGWQPICFFFYYFSPARRGASDQLKYIYI